MLDPDNMTDTRCPLNPHMVEDVWGGVSHPHVFTVTYDPYLRTPVAVCQYCLQLRVYDSGEWHMAQPKPKKEGPAGG